MKVVKKSLIILFFLIIAVSIQGQKRNNTQRDNSYLPAADSICKKYQDSLRLISASVPPKKLNNLNNPYYYRLFVTPLLYHSPIKQAMDIRPSQDQTTSDAKLTTTQAINEFLCSMYLRQPQMVNETEALLEKQSSIRDDINTKVDHKVQVSEIVKPKEVESVVEPIVAISRKPNFWTFKGNASAQIQQFYFSDNWYQGGTNYNSMIVTSWMTLNYNNKQKVQFDNKLEMNLGFQTNKDDQKHKFKTNTDLLRLTNKLGIQASGHWYYTISLQSWTQFYPKYPNNSDYVNSDFMSPFESVLSIGMDYKLNKKKITLSLAPAPLSYDFKYVDRKKLVNSYGTRGHHSMEAIGSNLTCNLTWKLFKELTWNSRLFYFTNYKMVKVEWENTFAFTINKYLNTKLYLYPRFDDSYRSNKSNAVLQFKEYLSLGFNYNF